MNVMKRAEKMSFIPLFAGMLITWLAIKVVMYPNPKITELCFPPRVLPNNGYLYPIDYFHGGKESSALPRILCFLNTYPKTFESKAIHVHYTWARKCTQTVFTSTAKHPVLKILKLKLPTPETRSHLWTKLRMSLREVRNMPGFDYYYRADDDTYAIIENLFEVAKMHTPDDAFMTGFRMKHEPISNHFGGGGGYIISRRAMSAIVDMALDKHPRCPTYDGWKDDLYIAACATAVGVKLYDTRNPKGRSLFYCRNVREYVNAALHRKGLSGTQMPCQRDYSVERADDHISFHYMIPSMQYIMEFLVYYAWPLGLRNYGHCKSEEF